MISKKRLPDRTRAAERGVPKGPEGNPDGPGPRHAGLEQPPEPGGDSGASGTCSDNRGLPRSRRVIAKAEMLPEHGGGTGANPRLIVTSLPASTHPGQNLYEKFCCARGDAENKVREM